LHICIHAYMHIAYSKIFIIYSCFDILKFNLITPIYSNIYRKLTIGCIWKHWISLYLVIIYIYIFIVGQFFKLYYNFKRKYIIVNEILIFIITHFCELKVYIRYQWNGRSLYINIWMMMMNLLSSCGLKEISGEHLLPLLTRTDLAIEADVCRSI
jgi:hypothetical protein